jgi:hypothetical protein
VPRQRWQRLLVAITLLALIAATPIARLPIGTAVAAAASPDLRLRPNDGPAGSVATARGRNFAPGATGSVLWAADGTVLASFTADDTGDFDVKIGIPVVPAGTHTVIARGGAQEATDTFVITEPRATPVPTPATASVVASPLPLAPNDDCAADAARRIDVHNAAELETALASAQPGDVIQLANGVYPGTFVVAAPGAAAARIALCGTPNAVIDGGDVGNGYALHVTAGYWTIHGLTVTNALKGIMLDDADFVVLDQVTVHTIGHEGVHFRTNSSDNVIQDSQIYDTGRKRDKFGEGVYIGSAVSNWGTYTGGEEDRSDRNAVLRNRIWNTTAESIDVKEGTTGGLIEGNTFDGTQLTGADSWLDLKGNGYLVRANTGTNSPTDGFQTHVINDLPWGRDNVFEQNVAEVSGTGYGFYIHQPDRSNNTVRCDNRVEGAASGYANVPCTERP